VKQPQQTHRDLPRRFSEPPDALKREPLLARQDPGWLTDTIASIPENPMANWWKTAFVISLTLAFICLAMSVYLISTGTGIWGINHPVMWGWAIINFVWWIGIGHAGTLISAILFLFRQRWRTSIHRAAEVMTIFAVLCASIFPLIHLGRVWFAWWLLPIPTANGLWPQFKSPLMWDVFAILTYVIVSILFCYLGLLPDLAVMRDRTKSRIGKILYGLTALGWTGSGRQWQNYQTCYLLLAGLATALVISVHSIVSMDFSVTQLPGWHSTIFPPYFVVGAIFSGLGMVLLLLIPLRTLLKLEDIITTRHIDLLCKAALAVGWLVAYAHMVELFNVYFGGKTLEKDLFLCAQAADPLILAPLFHIVPAPHWQAFWTMILLSFLVPQLFWFKTIRKKMAIVFLIAIAINIGMWLERFLIITVPLSHDFLPANWKTYTPTVVDVLTFVGSFGVFFTLYLLFIRYLPFVSIAEVKSISVSQITPTRRSEIPATLTRQNGIQSPPPPNAFAILAEFETPAEILHAAKVLRSRGITRFDAFTPFPIPGLGRVMNYSNPFLGWLAFIFGSIGFALGLFMIYWMNVKSYPILIGGKPLFSFWSAFPIAFETATLFAVIAVFVGMIRSNHLPELCHPLLGYRRFALASHNRFFVVIEIRDPKQAEARQLLQSLGGARIEWVKE